MDFPRCGTSRSGALPEIYVHDSNHSHRFRMPSRSNSYNSSASPPTASIAMSIPNAREPVPPPLPPPPYLADIADGGSHGPDLAWQWGNSHEDSSQWGRSAASVKPGSSLYGSFSTGRRSLMEERPEFPPRRGSTISTITSERARETAYPRDEGYASIGTSNGSYSSKFPESSSLRSGFQSAVHEGFRSTAQAYDKSVLQKLDSRRGSDNTTPPRPYSKPIFSSSASDASPRTHRALEHRGGPNQLTPLSLPILPTRPGFVESPLSRWSETPLSSGISPGNPYSSRFGMQGHFENRSPSDIAESDRSPLPYIRRPESSSVLNSTCDDVSNVTSRSRESYDHGISPENDIEFHMEETGLRRLHIDEYSTRQEAYSPGASTGQKRRASSPPSDDGPSLNTVSSASDLYRRRESASRASPSPRFHSTDGSISSISSAPRNNSYASNLSPGSSWTSLSSYGKMSPGAISPGGTDMSDSPYTTSLLNPSPRGSLSRPNHQRTLSETRPLVTSRKASDSGVKHVNTNKIHGGYMCECCPKKPKKFDSQEELNAHEQEKQYECAYCRNRFKNKNEAERHQNSLHLRRHSWSCAALSGYAAAFHNSPNRPNEADTCGYCGEDFPRSGISSPLASGPPIAVATDQDWDIRIGHLQEMHKFGECNHAKKFFRADHFRQHLKHSHAGTSGKWTNMLENACMKDEPLPEPIRGPERISPGGGRVGRISEEEELL